MEYEPTEDSLRSLLSFLEIEITKETSDQFYARCPHPDHNDSNPSWSMSKHTGQHFCFGCHFSGNAVTLAKDIAGQPLYRILGEDTPKDTDFHTKRNPIFHGKRKSSSAKVKRKRPIELEGTEYDPYKFPHVKRLFRQLNVSHTFVKNFGLTYVKYATINGTEFVDRVLFRVKEKGRLKNIEGRDVSGEQEPKVLYPYRGSIYNLTSDLLWNFDGLKFHEPLVVCEGIKDTIKIWQSVTTNVTSVFGNRLAAHQKELLKKFDTIIVFADNDAGGEALIDQIDDLIKDREFYVALPPERGQDPADLTVRQIKEILTHPIEAVDYFLKDAEASAFYAGGASP